MALRLAVDESWNGVTGTGRYSIELSERLKQSRQFEIHGITRSRPANPLYPLELSYELLKSRDCPVFWSPQYMMPLFSKQRIVITVHDLIMMKYRSRSKSLYFTHFMKDLYRRADKIITVSNAIKEELVDWIGCPNDDVIVITNGLSSTFSNSGDRKYFNGPYFLYVGNHRFHKNLNRLIKAFSIFRAREKCQLVMTGNENKELMLLAKEYGVEEDLIFVGFPDNDELAEYYRGAVATLYISIYEGFGLPIIESMACGTPVIVANVGAMLETAGDAGFLVNPYDEDEIADAMEKSFQQDEFCKSLIELGLRRSATFSWDDSFEKLSSVLLSVA